jgi:hypothetical protein
VPFRALLAAAGAAAALVAAGCAGGGEANRSDTESTPEPPPSRIACDAEAVARGLQATFRVVNERRFDEAASLWHDRPTADSFAWLFRATGVRTPGATRLQAATRPEVSDTLARWIGPGQRVRLEVVFVGPNISGGTGVALFWARGPIEGRWRGGDGQAVWDCPGGKLAALTVDESALAGRPPFFTRPLCPERPIVVVRGPGMTTRVCPLR